MCLCFIGSRSNESETNLRHKSVSTERTFGATADVEYQLSKLRDLCANLAQECVRKHLSGRGLTLKLKDAAFVVKQQQTKLSSTLPSHSDFANDEDDRAAQIEETLFRIASPMLADEQPIKLRLIGIRLSQLENVDDAAFFQDKEIMLEEAFANASKSCNSTEKRRLEERIVPERPCVASASNNSIVCPICNQSFSKDTMDNKKLNTHIDICLNRPLISDFSSSISRPSKKQSTIKNYFRT